jgi:hypothetical protein
LAASSTGAEAHNLRGQEASKTFRSWNERTPPALAARFIEKTND